MTLRYHGIAPADLVALHDIDVVGGQRHEQRGLASVVLRIAIGVEDPIVLRRAKPLSKAFP